MTLQPSFLVSALAALASILLAVAAPAKATPITIERCQVSQTASSSSVSAVSGEQVNAIVSSFLRGESSELSALEGSFATSTPEIGLSEVDMSLSMVFLPAVPSLDAPHRLSLARSRTQDEMAATATSSMSSKKDLVPRRAKSKSGPDALEFSRAAFPMVVMPTPLDSVGIRPMVGPVVGVRPAYIKPASFK